MLCVSFPKCDKRVPLYLLEEHHLKHEEEDREYMQMVANIQVIKVKKRVPAEKVRDQQDGEVHGEGQRGQPAEEVKENTIVWLRRRTRPGRRRRRVWLWWRSQRTNNQETSSEPQKSAYKPGYHVQKCFGRSQALQRAS